MTRVRFAPSPTGKIHIGNVRAALFNHIFAKKTGGALILRFEDTDQERSSKDSERSIIEDLQWLGIKFQEGPHIGGRYGPYRQSERISIYQKYAQELLKSGHAEKVITPPDDPKYAQNAPTHAIRFLSPKKRIQFSDIVFGSLEKEIEDFIILKSNGKPTFHLAVVVDDYLMQITHVIRGQDHLSNTPKHIALAQALGFPPPQYAHYSLTKGLSKRDKSQSIAQLRAEGYLPEAIINAAILLGWSPRDGIEKCNIFEQLEYFSLTQFTKANSHFDAEKFEWLAAQYMKDTPTEQIFDAGKRHLQEAGLITEHSQNSYIYKVLELLKTNISHLSAIPAQAAYFFRAPDHRQILQNPALEKLLHSPDTKKTLQTLIKLIEKDPYCSAESLKSHIHTISQEIQIGGKSLFMPIRLALTGSERGPELYSIAEILGKRAVISRLTTLLQSIEKAFPGKSKQHETH